MLLDIVFSVQIVGRATRPFFVVMYTETKAELIAMYPIAIDIHNQKKLIGAFKYLGIILTTGLSIYCLRKKTVIESSDPLRTNQFTPAGKRYLAALVAATSLTILVSIWENNISERIEKEARLEGDKELITLLEPKLGEQQRQVEKGLTQFTSTMDKAAAGLKNKLENTTVDIRHRMENNAGEEERRMRLVQRDLSLSNFETVSYWINMHVPGTRVQYPEFPDGTDRSLLDGSDKKSKYSGTTLQSPRFQPSQLDAMRTAIEDACTEDRSKSDMGWACRVARLSESQLRYSTTPARYLGASSATRVSIYLRLRSAAVEGRNVECPSELANDQCMEFRMTDLSGSGHPPDTAILKQPMWGADTETGPTPEELGVAFTIQPYDQEGEGTFFSRDTDVISLTITLCAINWSKRDELNRIEPQKQWNVQVVSLGKPRYFTKDYKMVLSGQRVSPDDSSCLVRNYLPQYLPEEF